MFFAKSDNHNTSIIFLLVYLSFGFASCFIHSHSLYQSDYHLIHELDADPSISEFHESFNMIVGFRLPPASGQRNGYAVWAQEGPQLFPQ